MIPYHPVYPNPVKTHLWTTAASRARRCRSPRVAAMGDSDYAVGEKFLGLNARASRDVRKIDMPMRPGNEFYVANALWDMMD